MIHVDRRLFFDGYRDRFGRLRQRQVDGLEALLGFLEGDEEVVDVRWAAYMLATVKHECADTYQPIEERGPRSYFDKYEPGTKIGRRLGSAWPGDGYLFRGRGYPQLTGRSNYQRMANRLHISRIILDPDSVREPRIAYAIMSLGMREGLFTTKALGDYINDEGCDYRGARRIINGLDKADLIAGYARDFAAILRDSMEEG